MKLPGGDRAIIPVRKIEAYVLNPRHFRGAHKARLFRSALDLDLAHADVLRSALSDTARNGDAELIAENEYGTLFRIEFVLEFNGRRAWIFSGWLLPLGGAPPLLTTTFPFRK